MQNGKGLKEIYIQELHDLCSANDQMEGVVNRMADQLEDGELSSRLHRSAEGIHEHTALLEALLEELGQTNGTVGSKAMEGLAHDAEKLVSDTNAQGPSRDVIAIAQYQKMCHYGIAGFGTAKAYAHALGLDAHENRLDDALERIYEADDYMTELAERSRNLRAAGAEAR